MGMMVHHRTGTTYDVNRAGSHLERIVMEASWCGAASASECGNPELVIVDTNINSQWYADALEGILMPYLEPHHSEGIRFQKDNTSCHTSMQTIELFINAGLNVLTWPAKILVLNPIENLW